MVGRDLCADEIFLILNNIHTSHNKQTSPFPVLSVSRPGGRVFFVCTLGYKWLKVKRIVR